jgi:serine/threonine protein kinase
LPHQIIPLCHIKNDDDFPQCGVGLLSVATNVFFSPIQATDSIQVIRYKILTALQAIESMHQLGWIHGDLKAEHFRLYENSCRLIDFEQSYQLQPIQI